MWFLYSIIALLCWSGSDLFSKMGSKPDDKYSHWKMVMAVGLKLSSSSSNFYAIVENGLAVWLSLFLENNEDTVSNNFVAKFLC